MKRLLLVLFCLPLAVQAAENSVVARMRAKAEQGVAGAQYSLAELYANGTSVPRDASIAFLWYRKAAEQGLRDAQFSLAMAYLEGIGVAKDATEGLAWLKIVSDKGGGTTMIKFREKLEQDLSPAVVAGAERRREVIEREIAARRRTSAKTN